MVKGNYNEISVISMDRMVQIEKMELLRNLFASDMQIGTSVELLMEADCQVRGKVAEHVILRGFEMKSATDQAEVYDSYACEQYESHLARRRNPVLCFPGEDLQGIAHCYMPGGYAMAQMPDLNKIKNILSENRNCGISFLFSEVDFSESEISSICANLDWIGTTFPSGEAVKRAIRAYEAYLEMKTDRKFFVCVSAWGEYGALDDVFALLRKSGFEIMDLPQRLFSTGRYLREGANLLVEFAQNHGHILGDGTALPAGCERLNYIASAASLPFLQKVSKGVSGRDNGLVASPTIDTQSPVIRENNALYLGAEAETGEAVHLPLEQLTSHLVIAGMSGSGKTSLMFQILLQLEKEKIPFLIIEPTKTEYRGLVKAIPEMKILTPGRTEVSPVMFNPFLPPKGITLEQFLPNLIAAFQMAFSLTTPLDVILTEVVRNVYVKYNWRNDSTRDSSDVTIFGMNEFICAFKEEIQNSSYDPESKMNLNSGGVYRFQSLINSNPYLFDTDKSLDLEMLLDGNTLIELDGIDNPEHKTLFIALLLLQLKLVIHKNQKKDGRLKNVIMIDEAHVLLDQNQTSVQRNEANPSGKLQEYLLNMVRENRVYGTGMIFADQSLYVLEEFVNNANVKMIMHLESAAEREFISANLNLSGNVYRKIASLKKGEYFLSYGSAKEPVLVEGADSRGENAIPDDLADSTVHSLMKQVAEKPFYSCPCRRGCDLSVKNEADFIARKLCSEISNLFKDQEVLEKYIQRNLDDAICQIVEDSDFDSEKRLARCARLMTERMIRTKTFFS